MRFSIVFSLFLLSSILVKADDMILCRYNGSNYPAIKIEKKYLEVGKCPIILPSNIKDYQFRVSRHQNSGLLRVIIENKKKDLWIRSLGGGNEAFLTIALSAEEGKEVAKQVGLEGSTLEEITVGCGPSYGLDSEAFLQINGSEDCNK